MKETKFYMTYSRDEPQYLVPWVEDNDVPLLTNAAHRWSDRTERFNSMFTYDTDHVIDAGGYNVLASKGEYPWDVETYHEWLEANAHEVEWATTMDYACEERFDEIMSVQERIDKTVEHTVEQFGLDRSYDLRPILQGRSVWHYITSYWDMEAHEIPLDHVGIGTLCRMASEKAIVGVEERLRWYLGLDTIHGFGVKINAYKNGAEFDTADSAAWNYPPCRGDAYVLKKTPDEEHPWGMDAVENFNENAINRVMSFQSYYAYVTSLMGDSTEPAVDPEPILDRREWSDAEWWYYLKTLEEDYDEAEKYA